MAKTYPSISCTGLFQHDWTSYRVGSANRGLLEVIGGLFLILGLMTRIVALLFAIEMISAFIIVNTSNVVVLPEANELGLLSIPIRFMAISISLTLTEPGRFSVEWNIINRELFTGKKDMLQALK